MTALWLAWWGCADLAEDESASSDCDVEQMEAQAGRSAFQMVFSACGANNFGDATWSITGHELYYQLGMTQHVLLADTPDKRSIVVPTASPTGPAAWLVTTGPDGRPVSRKIVHPIAPATTDGPERITWWDMDEPGEQPGQQATAHTVDIPAELHAPRDLSRSRHPDHVLLTLEKGGARRVYDLSLTDGALEEAWTWLGTVDRFTYTPAADRVVAVKGDTATVWDTDGGKALGTWAPAVRGTVHPKGRWMVLEHLGEPVSVFGPDNPAAAELEAKLPPDAARTVRPPMLSFVNLETHDRFLLDAIQGTEFEWYELTDYYGSFQLWGYDRKQERRNIMLGDLLTRLTGSEIGSLVGQTRQVGEKEGFLYGAPPDAEPVAP